MTDVPHYRDQPATLDPKVEIPEDAPLAQGHDEDKAADVAEAAVAFRDAVEAEAEQEEVGPGDPTVRRDPETGEQVDSDDEAVPNGTVDDVLEWVGDDPSRASRALTAERAGQNRVSLVSKLEQIAG